MRRRRRGRRRPSCGDGGGSSWRRRGPCRRRRRRARGPAPWPAWGPPPCSLRPAPACHGDGAVGEVRSGQVRRRGRRDLGDGRRQDGPEEARQGIGGAGVGYINPKSGGGEEGGLIFAAIGGRGLCSTSSRGEEGRQRESGDETKAKTRGGSGRGGDGRKEGGHTGDRSPSPSCGHQILYCLRFPFPTLNTPTTTLFAPRKSAFSLHEIHFRACALSHATSKLYNKFLLLFIFNILCILPQDSI